VGVAVSGNRAYVTNQVSDSVTVINTANNQKVKEIMGLDAPTLLAVSPGGGRVYVTNNNSPGKLSVINTATYTVTTIPVGDYPAGVAVAPTGRVYVAHESSSDGLSVINTATTPR
jgi:YVTN family beta-propeller protein